MPCWSEIVALVQLLSVGKAKRVSGKILATYSLNIIYDIRWTYE